MKFLLILLSHFFFSSSKSLLYIPFERHGGKIVLSSYIQTDSPYTRLALYTNINFTFLISTQLNNENTALIDIGEPIMVKATEKKERISLIKNSDFIEFTLKYFEINLSLIPEDFQAKFSFPGISFARRFKDEAYDALSMLKKNGHLDY